MGIRALAAEGEEGLRRASKGAMCTAAQLKAACTVALGADRLRRQVRRCTHPCCLCCASP